MKSSDWKTKLQNKIRKHGCTRHTGINDPTEKNNQSGINNQSWINDQTRINYQTGINDQTWINDQTISINTAAPDIQTISRFRIRFGGTDG